MIAWRGTLAGSRLLARHRPPPTEDDSERAPASGQAVLVMTSSTLSRCRRNDSADLTHYRSVRGLGHARTGLEQGWNVMCRGVAGALLLVGLVRFTEREIRHGMRSARLKEHGSGDGSEMS